MDMDEDQQAIALFHTLDRLPAPHHLEFPDGHDPARARAGAASLKARLDRDLGGPCTLHAVEDASYSFSLTVPAEHTGAGVPIAVRLSNYGDLAVVTAPAPDSHPDLAHAVAADALSEADREHIEAALSELGHRLVPNRPLHRLYDGVTGLTDDTYRLSYGPHAGRATWWTRFFEHL